MKSYLKELKDSIIARMLPPNNVSIPDMVRETGLKDTLYTWRSKARTGELVYSIPHCTTTIIRYSPPETTCNALIASARPIFPSSFVSPQVRIWATI